MMTTYDENFNRADDQPLGQGWSAGPILMKLPIKRPKEIVSDVQGQMLLCRCGKPVGAIMIADLSSMIEISVQCACGQIMSWRSV